MKKVANENQVFSGPTENTFKHFGKTFEIWLRYFSISRIHYEYGKIRTRKTLNTDTFTQCSTRMQKGFIKAWCQSFKSSSKFYDLSNISLDLHVLVTLLHTVQLANPLDRSDLIHCFGFNVGSFYTQLIIVLFGEWRKLHLGIT